MAAAIDESAHDPNTLASNSGLFFKRAYQACINCRKRKVKCTIQCNEDGRLQPSCTRCKRELRRCTFSADRRTHVTAERDAYSSQRTIQVMEDQPPQVDRRSKVTRGHEPITNSAFTPATQSSSLPQDSDGYEGPRPRKRPWSERDQSATILRLENTDAYSQENGEEASFTDLGVYATGSNPRDPTRVPLHDMERPVYADSTVASDLAVGLRFGNSIDNQNDGTTDHPNSISRPSAETYVEPWSMMRHPLSVPGQQTLDEWNAWRFVKLGLITSQEAVTYVDLFFRNMCLLSPILHDYYQDHSNHHTLITREPVLCCTIIALSARYHILAVDGGLSRGFYIHDRLWKHCQSLFHRIVWDQRRSVKDQIRHLGTMESFLLVTEWHPRSAHLAPEDEFGEFDVTASGDEDNICHSKVPNKWLQEVEEIAQRSDRMSWMLLGGALTLGHELDLFDDNNDVLADSPSDGTKLSFANFLLLRRGRLRRLMFVYISQLASRIGCALPKTPFHTTISSFMSMPHSMLDHQWHDHMTSWIDLCRLGRTTSEFLFPSKSVTRELLRSGRYSEFLDHFRPLLSQWSEKYLQNPNMSVYHQFLSIDYNFIRLYINSLALQAVVNRMAKHQAFNMSSQFEGAQDSGFVREVISGTTQILEMVITLAKDDHLKYIPVRLYIRIASAAIYLINALALGVRRDELDKSLSLLDRSVQTLRLHAVDDVHLGVRFASLLRNHIKGLRERFIRVYNPVTTPLFGLQEATYTGHQTPISIDMEFRSELPQQQGTIPSRSSLDINLGVPPSEEHSSNSGGGTKNNPYMQGRQAVREDEVLSDRDWFTLPFNAPADDILENTFMQSFFEIDQVDSRFFWDISV